MTSSVWLIAEREFRTYVATLSFWVALAIGPLAACGAVFLPMGSLADPAIAIHGGDTALARSVAAAIGEAGRAEGRHLRFAPDGAARLTLSRRWRDEIDLRFGGSFPLSASGRALAGRILERDAARAAAPGATLVVRENRAEGPRGPDAAALSRFVSMMLLWLALTGSLGMLLQTVVRERASRALESLLAAARPVEVVLGKVVGIGAVSLLVLAAWLGSAAALSAFAAPGLAPVILAKLASPALLLRDAVIYLCAYGFYGTLTVMLGALARDVAAGQNLARPMFVLLLAGFFLSLSCLTSNGGVSGFVYLPVFTPFLLLVYPPGAIALWSQALLLAVLLAGALFNLGLASQFLSVSPDSHQIFGWRTRAIPSLVQ